jgi:biopolymer transport protein TolR
MAFDVSPASGVRNQVNITPLIDVVLVLLIIFMVLTPTQMKHMKPAIAQPATTAASDPPPLTVKLSATGALALNGESTDWQRLPAMLRQRLPHDRRALVYFDIADDADYASAVRLMDLCRGAGAQVLALAPHSPS